MIVVFQIEFIKLWSFKHIVAYFSASKKCI